MQLGGVLGSRSMSHLLVACNSAALRQAPCRTAHCYAHARLHTIAGGLRPLASFGAHSHMPQRATPARAATTEAAISQASEEAQQPSVELLTSDQSDQLLRIRHSRLYPDAKVTIGPWIDYGFYYDFDIQQPLTDKDLARIQNEMKRIIKKGLPFIREEVSAAEAASRIAAAGESYKQEILDDIVARDPDAPITIYHIGDTEHPEHWWDLCAGPHVPDTRAIDPKAIQLETVAGAYWRGDEKRQQLQRIYGTAWQTSEQLQAYLTMKEEAARRDHRKLGQELDLFSITESVGGGLVFWHPKGAMIRHVLESFWKDVHLKRGYQLLYSPHIAKVDLWKTSGHFDFYRENMYDQMEVEAEEYQLKPMNCPFHIAVYKQGAYSYRDLPLRWAELGTVYRYERSGTMHGLFRVRGFTQDDAHIFCLPDQIESEIVGVLDLTEELLGAFGFREYEINLSTRPEKSVGDDAVWARAEAALQGALQSKGWAYTVDAGGGAFYGPKIDIKIKDAIGRKWQCSTVQLDFNLPERFAMEYKDSDGTKQQPIMVHRAIFGSLERFFGILVENYAGAFPLWLAPVQVALLPVVAEVEPFAAQLAARLNALGLRAEVQAGQRIGKLIRNAETSKVPVMCVVGKKEVENGTLSVRTYAQGELGSVAVDELVALLVEANTSKRATISPPTPAP